MQVFHYSEDLFWQKSTILHYSGCRFSFSYFGFSYLCLRSPLYNNNTGIHWHYDSSNNDSTPAEMWREQLAVESEALPGTPCCRRSARAWMKRGSIYHWTTAGFPSWFSESSSKSLWSSCRDQIQCDLRCKATVDPIKPVISMGFLPRDQEIVHLIQIQHLLNTLMS